MKSKFTPTSEISRQQFMQIIKADDHFEAEEIDLIERAFLSGERFHKDQKRMSGSKYFQGHCVHVAIYLYNLNMSAAVIAAGLLHDSIEDTDASYQDLEELFGQEIAFLVDGVTHLGNIKYRYYKRHVASLRKFFIAVSKDVRVIIIKLCDRYHNLQTLQYLPADKRKRIAEESLLIHAPLAARLNIPSLSQAINDLAFVYADPENYDKVFKIRKQIVTKALKTVRHIYRKSLSLAQEELGYQPLIDYRIKSLYSLYRKLILKKWRADAIYDLVALRIIVKTQEECYRILGVIHRQWKPLPGRFKDYIALPKANGYQSLHTIVFSGSNLIIEFQIKTEAMHYRAEYGSALHSDYKTLQTKEPYNYKKEQYYWLDQLKLLHNRRNLEEETDLKTYLKELETDLFKDQLFVMTPKGDPVNLPNRATVLDFAFAIHTELGVHARGGYVNGIYKALKTKLQTNDIVEIIIDKKVTPQKEWLTWVTTPSAKHFLRNFLKKQESQS